MKKNQNQILTLAIVFIIGLLVGGAATAAFMRIGRSGKVEQNVASNDQEELDEENGQETQNTPSLEEDSDSQKEEGKTEITPEEENTDKENTDKENEEVDSSS
ncbi:MAG: hypothetical protein IJU50_10540, partial [Lachnospiraceae bacterium]|nr:hypothetical protein [Lachnospiraceae bacterium]